MAMVTDTVTVITRTMAATTGAIGGMVIGAVVVGSP
jgi:hypothetical protein